MAIVKQTTARKRALGDSSSSAAKRGRLDSLDVGDESFSLKGLKLVLADIECTFCGGWSGGMIYRIQCNSKCTKAYYVCESCSGDNEFRAECLQCHSDVELLKDVTAFQLLRNSFEIPCTKDSCHHMLTYASLEDHLNHECSFNLVLCGKPGCELMYAKKNKDIHHLNCQSTACLFKLEDPEGNPYGCTWVGNAKDREAHHCRVGSRQSFAVLRACYEKCRGEIEDRDEEIKRLKKTVGSLQKRLPPFDRHLTWSPTARPETLDLDP